MRHARKELFPFPTENWVIMLVHKTLINYTFMAVVMKAVQSLIKWFSCSPPHMNASWKVKSGGKWPLFVCYLLNGPLCALFYV